MTAVNPIPVLHAITRLIVGGAQENTLFTAELLDSTRFSIDVIIGPQAGSEGSLVEEANKRNIKVIVLPELVRQINFKNDYIALNRLTNFIAQNQYLIVHTHSSKAGILGRIAAYRAKTPVIIHTVHGWSFHDHMNPALRYFYILLEKLCARFTDALIFVSERDMTIGKTANIGSSEHKHLIRSAIPLELFNPTLFNKLIIRQKLGIPESVPVLGNVGRFSPQKDPLSWVKVAVHVSTIIPDCWFLLIGDGPLRRKVEDELTKNRLIERTVFTGIRRDVARYLSAMDVFLITSLWEGMPRVIPQAMAMRVPVVANHVPGIDEVIHNGKTGYLANIGDYETLARHCSNLLSDSALRQSMSQNAETLIKEQFDLSQMISRISDLYGNLLKEKLPN